MKTDNIMNVMIVGFGYVGSAVGSIFKPSELVIIDPKYTDNQILNYAGQRFDCIFVCVDTPKGKNTELLDEILYQLNLHIGNKTPVCCKSTALPDYYEYAEKEYSNLGLVHSPEYLSSENNIEMFQKQTFAIFGGKELYTEYFAELFSERLEFCKNIKTTDIKTAALVKYSENAFLSLKVTFMNELYQIHKKIGCTSSFEDFAFLLGMDPRIGQSHTRVPGWDGKFGWGGHCFEKDNYELSKFSDSPLIRFMISLNEEHRNK